MPLSRISGLGVYSESETPSAAPARASAPPAESEQPRTDREQPTTQPVGTSPVQAPPQPTTRTAQSVAPPRVEPTTIYGYTGAAWDQPLDAASAYVLVSRISEHIGTRGLDSKLLFSSQAPALSATASGRLIRALLATLPNMSENQEAAERQFEEELQFADVYSLVALLKWVLARVGRVVAERPFGGDATADLALYPAWLCAVAGVLFLARL